MDTSEFPYSFEFLIKSVIFTTANLASSFDLNVFCNSVSYRFPNITGPRFRVNQKLILHAKETDTLIELKLIETEGQKSDLCTAKIIISDIDEDRDAEIQLKEFENTIAKASVRFRWIDRPVIPQLENFRTLKLNKIAFHKNSHMIGSLGNLYFEFIIGTKSLMIMDNFQVHANQGLVVFRDLSVFVHKNDTFYLNCYIKAQSSFLRDIIFFSALVKLKNKMNDVLQTEFFSDKDKKPLGYLAYQLVTPDTCVDYNSTEPDNQEPVESELSCIKETCADMKMDSEPTAHNTRKSDVPTSEKSNPKANNTSIVMDNNPQDEIDEAEGEGKTQVELRNKLKDQ